jgi:hypothetical protein
VFPVRYELNLFVIWKKVDHLCDLLARVPGYRSKSLGSMPLRYQFFLNNESGIGSTQPRNYN